MPSAAAVAALYDDAYAGATQGYFAKSASKLRRARRRVKRIARFAPPKAGARFLDVGCNAGYTVEAAREAGYQAHGIELDPVSYRFAKDHYPANQYFNGPIEDYTPGVTFDAVYCAEVIEHVPEVDRFTAAIAGLMRPGAILYMTTPDLGHWRTPKDVAQWSAFTPPGHCLFFTFDSLTRLLARHGLSVFRRQAAFKPGLKILARRTA